MPLKPYSELVQVDVTPYCKTRDKAQYLPWAMCKRLLHEHGADDVWYIPIKNSKGHALHMTDETFTDKNGNTHRCYEVWVEVHIDDKEYTMGYPVINGIHAVHDGSLSQRAVHTALARAFVKCVAIHTGLGFNLWIDDPESDLPTDDLSGHSIMAIKKRVEQTLTSKQQKGIDYKDILAYLELNDKQFKNLMGMYDKLYHFEARIKKA